MGRGAAGAEEPHERRVPRARAPVDGGEGRRADRGVARSLVELLSRQLSGGVHRRRRRERRPGRAVGLFSSSEKSLIDFLEAKLPASGNGSEEVRNWLVAHGAAGGRGFELVDYLPVPKVIVGCGFASWRV